MPEKFHQLPAIVKHYFVHEFNLLMMIVLPFLCDDNMQNACIYYQMKNVTRITLNWPRFLLSSAWHNIDLLIMSKYLRIYFLFHHRVTTWTNCEEDWLQTPNMCIKLRVNKNHWQADENAKLLDPSQIVQLNCRLLTTHLCTSATIAG